MHTRKASFRLPVIIACFAFALWLAAACGDQELESTQTPWIDPCIEEKSIMEDQTTERPSYEYMNQVRDKYIDLFEGYPHWRTISAGNHYDADGNPTGGYGITLGVAEMTDPSTLPEDRRIPDCLDGVSVRIIIDQGLIYTLGVEGD